jgi:phosphoglycerate dehydrogenase-like enzyme
MHMNIRRHLLPLLSLSFRAAVALVPVLLHAQPSAKIVVRGMAADRFAELRSAAPRASFVLADTPEDAMRELRDADALIGSFTPEMLRAAPKLRWVQVGSAGVETVLFPELIQSNITLTNCKIIQGPEISDHAFALLLALTRRLNELIPLKAKKAWPQREFQSDRRPIELNGRTALIIGLGGIGAQIAQRAWAFGMNVLAVDPRDMPMSRFVDQLVPPDRLQELLPRADVVFMAAPDTEQTRQMMGASEFARMKQDSFFIAVSRGKTYDGAALVKALDEKRLAGAGLDVTDPEPLPPDSPLWEFENVVITPHIAGQSDKFPDRQLTVFKENARRFSEGLPLINVVDKTKGY